MFEETEADASEAVPESDPGPDEIQPDQTGELSDADATGDEVQAEGADQGDEAEQSEVAEGDQQDAAKEPEEGAPEPEAEAPPADARLVALERLVERQSQNFNALLSHFAQQGQKQPTPPAEEPAATRKPSQAEKAAIHAWRNEGNAGLSRFPEDVQRSVTALLLSAQSRAVEHMLDPGLHFREVVEPQLKPIVAQLASQFEERIKPIEGERRNAEWDAALKPYQERVKGPEWDAFAKTVMELGSRPTFKAAPAAELLEFAYLKYAEKKGNGGVAKEKQKLETQQRQLAANRDRRRAASSRGHSGARPKIAKRADESFSQFAQRLQRGVSNGEISEQELAQLGG